MNAAVPAALAPLPRWVAWQTEQNPQGRITKVPKAPGGGNARADAPSTWGTLAQAEGRARQLPKPHQLGGVGFQLGDLGDGRAIGGLDLDSCRDPDSGALEPWAADILSRFPTYAEVSPSGTGVKAFFVYDAAARPVLVGTAGGRKWARGKGEHAPAVELYLTGRYFAVTGEHLDGTPQDLRPIDADTLGRLIHHDGPAFAGKPPTDSSWLDALGHLAARVRSVTTVGKLLQGDLSDLADSTRSGAAMAMGAKLKRAGFAFDEVAAVLRAWPETAEWCAEKGDAGGGRELQRLWERAGPPDTPAGGEFTTQPRPGGRIRLLSPVDCDTAEARPYVLKGLIAAGNVACIFGAPGAGKSVLAPHLAYAIAQGRPVFGRRARPGPVWYVAAEDQAGMRQRVRALRVTHGDAGAFALVEGVGNLLDPQEAGDLLALAALHMPVLIVVDTVAAAAPGIDENTSQDMGRVVAVARRLAATGAAVLLVHHDTKSETGTPRGHSILNGDLDMAMHLTKADEGGIIRGKLTKNRNGACDADIAFRLHVVTLGTDDDGDPITAPVAAEIADAAPRADRLPRAARAALDILRDLARAAPVGRVPESDWRAACCDGPQISTSDDRKARVKAFRRAFADLLDGGRVAAGGGEVWLPRADAAEFTGGGQRGQMGDISPLSPRQTAQGRGDKGDTSLKGVSPVPLPGDARHSEFAARADAAELAALL